MRAIVEGWLAEGVLPHALFSGQCGTGKTSLAKMLLNTLHIPPSDWLFLPASRYRQVEAFTDQFSGFVDAYAMNPSGIKYIILDEADKLSQHSQSFLRTEMETYADTCRIIMTANKAGAIIEPLHSRVQHLKFVALDRDEFTLRAADVLQGEGVLFEPEILLTYVEHAYPDLRKCITTLQQNTQNQRLHPLPLTEAVYVADYMTAAFALIRAKKHHAAWDLLREAPVEDYEDIYRGLYADLSMFGASQQIQENAVLVIRKGLVNHTQVAHVDINLFATLIELSRLA
jgi:DNA polymerase III delta prime subunit